MRKYAFFIAFFALIVCTSCTDYPHPMVEEITDGLTPYTIMIYMNGSDLESDFGLATSDLAEMLDSGLRSHNANVIILTGGTQQWLNSAIPANECVIWQLEDGWINELDSMGLVDMGNPTTLRNFIMYSIEHFPAEKYGLIMWDHGGGSIVGFGHDEKFNNSSLTLLEMIQAFDEAGLAAQKLEFLGFDACLMATVEMAILAADYAHVFIASEDLEPGDGWDYKFLGVLNDTPQMNGFALGKVIVDTFIDFYGPNSDEILTLSVVDLAKVAPVMDTMGKLMSGADIDTNIGFFELAKRRGLTKTFGEGSPRDNYSDMVDIGDMAVLLYELYPTESEAVLQALENCVVYNRHNSDIDLWGLSTFYIYGGKSLGDSSLETYAALAMNSGYTNFLNQFFCGLTSRADAAPVTNREFALWQQQEANTFRLIGLQQLEESHLWPKINGHSVALYPITTTENTRLYAMPAQINHREVDIVIAQPSGKILGSRNINERVYQKGYDLILPGDTITIYYLECTNDTQKWVRGDEFVAGENFTLTWEPAPHDCTVGYRITDACGCVSYHHTR